MIKKITITILSLFILVNTSIAYACNFKIGEFGDSIEKIKVDPFPVIFPDPFNGETVLIPIQQVCRDNKELFGTQIMLLYVDKKLLQVRLERPNYNDAKLMDFAMKKYGTFSLPAGIKKEDWRGNYQWENSSEIIIYDYINTHDGSMEILELNSKLYQKNLIVYFEKIGKWLDSQK